MQGVIHKSIQFVCNNHEGKGGKGGIESLRELTAGAEKLLFSHWVSEDLD